MSLLGRIKMNADSKLCSIKTRRIHREKSTRYQSKDSNVGVNFACYAKSTTTGDDLHI